jgi:CRP-like cAMP-binding protein
MIDKLRRDIQTRMDELLSEVGKLRRALSALSSRETSTPATTSASSSRTQTRRRARSTPAAPTPVRKRARSGASAASATAAPAPRPARSRATKPSTAPANASVRTARGATKTAVLAALSNREAMTAGEVANATGLGRASVSTTLSKLAKTGEVTKAARGYQLANQTNAAAPVTAVQDAK